MSKIYEALRRHAGQLGEETKGMPAHGDVTRAVEAIYPAVYRLIKEAGRGYVLHFVAASSGEGTSTLSSEFARVAARSFDSGVLLVDADGAKPSTAARFGCAANLGIVGAVDGDGDPGPALVRAADGLQVGALCGRQSQPLSVKRMRPLYELLRSRYELTIFDCPAVFSDRYFELAPDAADGIILVVEAERNRPEMIQRAKLLIDEIGGKLLGAILNRRQGYIPEFLYRFL
jgi:Mrp family chromosome partitioning ATPase